MPRPRKPPRYGKLPGKGPNYYIIHGRKTTSTCTDDEAIAQKKLADYILRQRGIRVPLEEYEMPVLQTILYYGNFHKEEKPWSAKRIESALKNLKGFWKDRTVAEIDPETISDYIRYRKSMLLLRKGELVEPSIGTIRREIGILNTALGHAYKTRRLKSVPRVESPPSPPPKTRWLSKEEAAALLAAAAEEPRSEYNLLLFIIIGLETGQRRGAIMELEWCQIDFERGEINFLKPGSIETKKRRSRVPISSALRETLMSRYEKVKGKSQFVFHQKTNPAEKVENLKKGFEAACKRADLSNVTQHTLRHTCTTWMALRGEHIYQASRFLNMTIQTLERVYAHHNPEDLQGIATRNCVSDLLPKNNLE